jgi:hypothetical protein
MLLKFVNSSIKNKIPFGGVLSKPSFVDFAETPPIAVLFL